MDKIFLVLVLLIGVYLVALIRACRAEKRDPPSGEFLVVEGLRLHFVRKDQSANGVTSGRTIVLLHGSDGFLQDFTETIFDRLAADYSVIAFDRPGHGYSDAPTKEPLTPQFQARLLNVALARLGIEQPLFVGHSWSGLLLMTYALQYPEAVAGLVLLAPWVYPPANPPSPLLQIALIPGIGAPLALLLLTPVKPLLIRYHLAQAFSPQPVPATYSRLANTLWQRHATQIVAFAQENTNERRAMRELSPRYPEIRVPITILTGNRDRAVNPAVHAFPLHRELPHSRLVVLEGVGHALLTQAPEAILAEIGDLARRSLALPEGQQLSVPTLPDAKARALVFRYGWNSVAYQILNPEMEHWFLENVTTPGEDSEAVIGFVRRNGVRIVAGAPICAENRLAAIAAQFEVEAHRAGERVCYFGATDRLKNALANSGSPQNPTHSAIVVGAQPVWRLENWHRVIEKNGSLRSQINRAKNKGVGVNEWNRERASSEPALQRCLDEWLAMHPFPTLHFLTEPVTLNRLADRRLFVAEQNRVPVGFLIATPIPNRRAWLIEQIVRGKSALNGTAELLVDGAMRTLASEGYETVTLGLAPLSRRVGDATSVRPLLRLLLKGVRAHGRRFYNFEGLDTFKAKFKPDFWEPIYALSDEPQFSLRTLYALVAAFSDGSPVSVFLRALLLALRSAVGVK